MSTKKRNSDIIAEAIQKTLTETLTHIMKTEGLKAAIEKFKQECLTWCTEDWFPMVARNIRKQLDIFAEQEQRERAMSKTAQTSICITNSMQQNSHVTTTTNASGDYVFNKNVQNEVNNVEAGASGININS